MCDYDSTLKEIENLDCEEDLEENAQFYQRTESKWPSDNCLSLEY